MVPVARVAIAAAFLPAAAAVQFVDNAGPLANFVASHRQGATDYWLTMQNFMGDVERVALIHGMASDLDFCNSLADAYREKYPQVRMFCIPAN